MKSLNSLTIFVLASELYSLDTSKSLAKMFQAIPFDKPLLQTLGTSH
jgi:hypothetical protein